MSASDSATPSPAPARGPEMEKAFDPNAVEPRAEAVWAQPDVTPGRAGVRVPGGAADAAFTVMIPPPNVTGTLHMGHAFQYTLQDALVRRARMQGHDTLWQPGTDHAGIATQMVVERNLKAAGRPSRRELGRDAFLDEVWAWQEKSGGTIAAQTHRLGNSVAAERAAFTFSPEYSKAVIEHFVRLHDDGLIYRGKRLVNWDPVLETAISDLEVLSEEEKGSLWHIRYPLADGRTWTDAEGGVHDHLTVATTRPETLLGDTAVAVNPTDERYQGLQGARLRLPLTGRTVPVVFDDYVEKDFGTGAVKITPAHDFNDAQVAQRQRLPVFNLLTPTAHLLGAAGAQPAPASPGDLGWQDIPEAYRGLHVTEARRRVVADLNAQGFLEKTEPHLLKVPRGDRSGAVIEPFLTDQWFVDLTDRSEKGGWTRITKPAIDAVASGRVRFVPDNWKTTYFQWLDHIQDWCISRQLWWGHRVPAWYDEAGRVFVARTEDEVRQKHGLGPDVTLRQDEDVFDTWFSSDLWPMATLGWPDATPELTRHYPGSVLVTGFDIIFFWVARMVMMGVYFMDDVPFRDVLVTGLVRDPEGQKMSKSKGNVLDPLDVVDGINLEQLLAKRVTGLMQPEQARKIEQKTRKDYPQGIAATGVDALRFTFASLATHGRDVRFAADRAGASRNFCNKLWNATRYVLMACEGQDTGLGPEAVELSSADRWIASRLQRLEAEVDQGFADYRFDNVARALYEFAWSEYCDWYLELSKPALQQGSEAAKRGTRRTLVRVLETLLRLLHPLMPFVTEDLWQRVAPLAGKTGPSLALQPWPVPDASKQDPAAEADVAWLQGFILGVRQIRAQMDLPPGRVLPVLVADATPADTERLGRLDDSIRFLARTETPRVLDGGDAAPESATALAGHLKILVPMAGLIDTHAELARLSRQLEKLQADREKTRARIDNPGFARAPETVQAQARAQAERQDTDIATLQAQVARIQQL